MAINKNKIIKAAQKFVEKGNLDKAIKEYGKIVQADPKDTRVRLKIGDLHVKRGEMDKAAATYRKVAESYAEQGFNTRAVAVFKQLLKLNPNDVSVHKRLASLYRQRGLVTDSLMQLEVLYKRLMKKERYKEAQEVVQEMVSLDEDNVALRIRLAESYSRDDMHKEAVEHFTIAAKLLQKAERTDDYVKVAERLLWHDPENVSVSKDVARYYIAQRESRRALQKLQTAFKADSQDVETLQMLAEAFHGLKQRDKSATILKELGKVYLNKGDKDSARRTFRRVLGLASDDKEAQAALRELEGGAQPAEPAQAAAMEAVSAVGPEDMADASLEYEEIEEIEEINEIEELDPDAIVESQDIDVEAEEVESVIQDIEAFAKYSLYDKALEHIQGLLVKYPDNLQVRDCYADLLAKAGRILEAVEEYRALATAVQEEDQEAAIGYLDAAVQLVPDDREVAEELARLTGRSATDIMAAVAGEDGPQREDLSELSGLQILEDIEAEAESIQPSFATQEISVSKVEALSHLRRREKDPQLQEATTLPEDNLEDLEDLGLLGDESWDSDDVVDFSNVGDVSFGPSEPTLDSSAEKSPFGADSSADLLATTPGGPERDDLDEISLPAKEEWTSGDDDQSLASEGHQGAARHGGDSVDLEAVSNHLAMDEDLDRELADLEHELGVLGPSDGPIADEAPDTAVVDADSVEREVSKEPEEELVLRPPDEEPAAPSDASMGEDDFLVDEFDQLQEAEQLIADLKEATGESPPVSGRDRAEESFEEEPVLDLDGVDFADLGLSEPEAAEPAEEAVQEAPEATSGEGDGASAEPASEPASGASGEAGHVSEPEEELVQEDDVMDLAGLADSWDDDDATVADMSAQLPPIETGPKGPKAPKAPLEPQTVEGGEPPASAEEPVAAKEPGSAQDEQAPATEEAGGEAGSPGEAEENALSEEGLETLREELQEADFFISQELFDDALDMLNDLKGQYGEHPELLAKIQGVREQSEGGGTEVLDEGGDGEALDNVLDAAEDALDGLDLLDIGDGEAEEDTRVQAEEPPPGPDQQLEGRDAEVFKQFRDGVAQQVGEEDSDTHFDLGIAYREMGMIQDAMEQFKKAMKSSDKEVQAHMMLAVCHQEMGKMSGAIGEYKRALHSDNITDEEQLDAYYQLGLVYESLKDFGESIYYMEKVVKRQPAYRDVSERLQALQERQEG